jgi:hypothetical protein
MMPARPVGQGTSMELFIVLLCLSLQIHAGFIISGVTFVLKKLKGTDTKIIIKNVQQQLICSEWGRLVFTRKKLI